MGESFTEFDVLDNVVLQKLGSDYECLLKLVNLFYPSPPKFNEASVVDQLSYGRVDIERMMAYVQGRTTSNGLC